MSPKARRKAKKRTGPRQARPAVTRPITEKQTPAEAMSQPVVVRSRTTKTPAHSAPPAAVYTNLSRELKTIGILAGALLVVLVVVAVFLS